MDNATEKAMLVVKAIYDWRCALWETSHREYERLQKLMLARGRQLAEQTEDDELRSFIEQERWFKPSPQELQYRAAVTQLENPEWQQKIHALQEQFLAEHGDSLDHDSH